MCHRDPDGFGSMDQIIDSIMVYTIENGMLTSVLTVASFVCVRYLLVTVQFAC